MPVNKPNTARISRDEDGWLIDRKTGKLIGPDPAIERELTADELQRVKRRPGRPALPEAQRRKQITLRFNPETIAALRAVPQWNSFAEEAVRRALKRKPK